MSKSRQLNIPDLLERLIAWQKDIAHEVPYLETPTGYFLNFDETDNGGYTCSPVDSIVFARTGYDGIHYSLLTDFGRVTNLSEAPVICVSPMDFGHCVRIVAENIKDFFALSLFGHDTFLLIDFPTKEAYMQHLREQQELKSTPYFDAELWTRQKKLVQEKAASAFSFPPIEDPFDYVQKVRAKRSANIVLRTSDSLGVVPWNRTAEARQYVPHPWFREEIPECDLEQIEAFLNAAELETILAFIRDCQEQAVSKKGLIHLIHQQLLKRGFTAEAKCWLNSMLL